MGSGDVYVPSERQGRPTGCASQNAGKLGSIGTHASMGRQSEGSRRWMAVRLASSMGECWIENSISKRQSMVRPTDQACGG